MLPQLPASQLNLTNSINNTGNVRRPSRVASVELLTFRPIQDVRKVLQFEC